MTSATQAVTPPSLAYFTVFSPVLGPDEETEHEQLLFYAASAPTAGHMPSTSPTEPCASTPAEAEPTTGWTDYLWGGMRATLAGSTPSPTGSLSQPTSPTPRAASRFRYPFGDTVAIPGASPVTVPLDAKIRQIGLIQGLSGCVATFAEEQPWTSVDTHKTRLFIYRPEPDVWLALCVNFGYSTNTTDAGITYDDQGPSNEELAAVVIQAHQTFCILHGHISTALKSEPQFPAVRALRRQLEAYYGDLVWQWQFQSLSLFQLLRGIPTQILSPASRDRFQGFLRTLITDAPPTATGSVLVLWHRRLAWSHGLNDDDTFTLYWYLAVHYGDEVLDPVETLDDTDQPTSAWYHLTTRATSRPTTPAPSEDTTHPVTCLSDLASTDASTKGTHRESSGSAGPLLYLGTDRRPHHLVLYTYDRALLVALLLPTAAIPFPNSLPTLRGAMGQATSGAAPDLVTALRADWVDTHRAVERANVRGHRFVHRHRTTQALFASWLYPFRSASTVRRGTGGSSRRPIDRVLYRKLRDLHGELERGNGRHETAVCTHHHGWVAGSRLPDAEVYVVVDKAGANLLSVDERLREAGALFVNAATLG